MQITFLHLAIIAFFTISIALLLLNLWNSTRVYSKWIIISKDVEKSIFTNQLNYTITVRKHYRIKTLNVSKEAYESLVLSTNIIL